MPQKYLIGVDIGTQGTKTALVSLEGQIIISAFEASKLISPSKGVVQQEADDIFFSVTNTIHEIMTKSGISGSDVLGIGIDAQMAGIMGIDQEWKAVTYYDSWLDTRCEKYIDYIKEVAEEKVAYQIHKRMDINPILITIKNYLEKEGHVIKAWLFGSYARGEDDYKSDIDVMIEVPEDSTFSLFDIAEIQYQLEKLILKKVDIVMKDGVKPQIMERIKPDLKIIYER